MNFLDNLLGPPKFKIVYADPPWHYNDRRNTHTRFCGGAMVYYDVMRTEEICAMPVPAMLDPNAMLFLWATWPNLTEAFAVMEAWGFQYKTCAFNWVKTNKKNGKPFFGIGYYTKSNSEICLLGVRGKPFKVSDSIGQIVEVPEDEELVTQTVYAPRAEHSKKPDCVRDKIVELCGDVPRIEMFSRQRHPGWWAYGNDERLRI